MLNLFLNKIKKSKQARSYLAVFISVFMFLSCANSGDPDQSDFDKIVNNFLISIVGQAIFANPSCGPGLIQIDTEAVPTGTTIQITQVEELFSNVDACVLDQSAVIDSNGQAFVEFLTDYVMGENATGQFRILITADTPDGQQFTQFTDIVVQGIAIVPPTNAEGSTTFTIEIPDMGLPPDLGLLWSTLGIKEGTSISFTFDAALGTVSPAAGSIDANGNIFVTYTPNAVEGIQTVTATITLTTPANILALCPFVSPSKTITATIRIVQTTSMAVAAAIEADCNDGMDDDMDGPADCADMDPGDCNPPGGPTIAPCQDGGETMCTDTIDNNGNGAIDCADMAAGSCNPPGGPTIVPCEDGSESMCNDGVDNDGNGAIDCSDFAVGNCNPPGGPTVAPCEDGTETICDDGIDNDGQGAADCGDPDCAGMMCAPGMTCVGGVCT